MIEVFRDPYFQCELNELDDLRTEANFTKIKVIAQKLLEDAKIQSNTYVEIIANYYLAEAALFSGETEKCIELSWHVLSFYKDRDYDNVFVLICSILGKAYGNQRDSYNALTFFLKGYYAAIDKKIPAVEYRILGNIGTLFFYLGYHEDAIIFYKRALRRISEIGSVDKKVYEVLLVNIMSVYIRMKDFVNVDKWKDLYEKEFPDTHNTVGEEGYIADKIIKSANVNNFKKMKRYVKELIDFSNKNWFHAYSIRLLFEIAQCCLHVSQFDLMKECLQCVSEHVHEEDLDARVELAQLYVELYEASNSDKLIEAYAQYFTLSKQRNKISRSMEYQGLHNKLSLEAELHEKQLLLKENKELNKKSESDLFTGVLNKASFVQRVNEELQRIDDVVGGALYVIDVDDFKHVNDDYGHLAGDEVLKKLAKVLQSYTRKSDVVGRIGGDEFCVYMGNIQDTIIIEKKAKQFLSAISKIKVDLAKDYEVKVSIGVASLRVKSDFEKAFAQADEALYEVKTNGKKSFSICYSH